MTYRLVIVLPFNTILAFKQKFASVDEALDYRDTKPFPALEPWGEEKIKRWKGSTIEFPFGEDNDRTESDLGSQSHA